MSNDSFLNLKKYCQCKLRYTDYVQVSLKTYFVSNNQQRMN